MSESTIPPSNAGANKGYLIAIVALSLVMAATTVLITIFREGDNLPLLAGITTSIGSVIATLLAFMSRDTHNMLNSELAKFKEVISKERFTAGFMEGQDAIRAQLEDMKKEMISSVALAARQAVEERAIAAAQLLQVAKEAADRVAAVAMAITPPVASHLAQASPTLSAMVIKEPDGTVKPVVVEEKK